MQTPVSYDDALAMVVSGVERLDSTDVSLHDALGRIAARDRHAPFALPGFANAAMDGFAVRGADLPLAADSGLPLVATILAGDTREYAMAPGTAMAIMTGAPMPQGADTVVIQEHARREQDRVWLPADARAGANVRAADDDCQSGTRFLSAGDVINPVRMAVLASFGLTRVEVVNRPRVVVLTTGDELVEPGQPLAHGQRYDSNGPLLAGLLADAGADVIAVRHSGDDPDRLRQQIEEACADDTDLLLTCGGVSAGEADHLPAIIAALGVVTFWKIRMKPGMPALCGRIGQTRVLALPGNPVSVGVTCEVLVRPLLYRLLGRPAPSLFKVRMATSLRKRHPRLEFLRATLVQHGDGSWLAEPLGHQGSGALTMLAAADALIRLEEGEREYQPGDVVQALRLPSSRA